MRIQHNHEPDTKQSVLEILFGDLEKLQITVNPTGSMSIVGEDVLLCCEANGQPPPDYYEWCVAFCIQYCYTILTT